MVEAFVDVKEKSFAGQEAEGTQYTNFGAVAIGTGSKVFRGDSSGIWLGAEKFVDAPFSVTMEGVVTMTSASVSGYVASIAGTYSSTATAAAAKIQLMPVDSPTVGIVAYASNGTTIVFKVEVSGTNVGDVTIGNYAGGYGMLWDQSAGRLYIKGDLTAGNIDADRITSGTLSTSRIPNLSADKITTGTLDADDVTIVNLSATSITTGILNGTTVSITNLNASNIVTGTLTVGSGGAGQIYANRSSASATGYYTWVGGSKIWVDSLNYMGFTSTGERFYFYTSDRIYALFQRGAYASFYSGVAVSGGGVIIGASDDAQNLDCYGWASFRGDVDINNYKLIDCKGINWVVNSNQDGDGKMWFYTTSGNYYLRMDMGSRQQFDTHGV